jgi:hypothetical protein
MPQDVAQSPMLYLTLLVTLFLYLADVLALVIVAVS